MRSKLLWPVIVAALVTVLSLVATAQSNAQPEEFTAFAVNLASDIPAAATATVDINITRWSAESERNTLAQTLREKGPDALLRALQKVRPVGRIKTPDSLGYDLRYAHQEPVEEGGRRIVIATDRPIGFWEARNRPRSIDYPFTVIEMHLDNNGVGEGRLSLATKITAGANVIVLENYSSQPVLLTQVKSKQGK
jgi:hypothetical protein